MLARIGLGQLRFALVFCSVVLAAPLAQAQNGPQETVKGAEKVLGDLRKDPAFGNAAKLLREAKAVLIIPTLYKGGFIVGGEGGNGVMMARGRNGWSDPAFYGIGSASFGLQAGLQQSEVIMLMMTRRALEGVLHQDFKLGAQAGISVATLGSAVQGATGGATIPDVVVWSSSTGLYGGLTLEGSIIKAQPNVTDKYYNRQVTVRQVLFGKVTTPKASRLRDELRRLG